jgi:energy-coupling factor transporter ATP-binding protein EcfA2
MSSRPSSTSPPLSNPFATRWIRPGAVPYLFLSDVDAFPPDVDAMRLVSRLSELGWWGQIVGNHGSGKSTLLHSLQGPLETAGRCVTAHQLHAGESRLPFPARRAREWGPHTQVIIDGYEQLGWYARHWLQRQCRLRHSGLLVTTHHPFRLPVLWNTQSTLAVALAVVARLLASDRSGAIHEEDVRQVHAACAGNLREMLFALYDLFEERTRSAQIDGRQSINSL